MMIKKLQIVAFDNPNPPDYGGAVEMFYKLKTFHQLGIKIQLHLFVYGDRTNYDELYDFCDKIIFYKRKMSPLRLFSKKPFIVVSREHPDLLKNLKENPSPILFEGIHSCGFIHRNELKNHFKIVRMHNIEQEYYKGLANSSGHWLKKNYFKSEARKLEAFEPRLSFANVILGITEKDAEHFKQYGKTLWIPPFSNTFSKVDKTEDYTLFHGNLSVSENYQAAELLLKKVFGKINSKVIIAGKSPVSSLISLAGKFDNVELIANPSQEKMDELITKAHCHILYTSQNTGVKLKLIHTIQTAGHIVMNSTMLFDSAYKNEIEIADSPEEITKAISKCMKSDEVKSREKLRDLFSNKRNAEQILEIIK